MPKQECTDLKGLLEKYKISKDDKIYMLNDDPTKEQISKTMTEITETLKKGSKGKKKKNYAVFYLFAGHGVVEDDQ